VEPVKTSEKTFDEFEELVLELDMARILFAEEEEEEEEARIVVSIKDVTDRKQAEEALSRSEENFRRSLDDSPLGVRIVTAEGETIYANRAILDINNCDSLEEMKAIPVEKRYTPKSFAEHQIRKEKRKRGDYYPSEYDISIIRKDGEVRHLHVFRKEILWNGEEQFQVIYQDITDRKLAEQAQVRLVAMLDAMPGFVGFADAKDAHILYINPAGRKMVGVHKLFRDEIFPTAIRDGLWTGECAFLNRDGHEIPVMMALLAHKSPSGEVVERFSTISIDITERKQTGEALRASQEQMRALAGRLQAVREEERTQIAREIHDELGGALTGLKIDVSLLTRAALKIENETTVREFLLDGMDSMTKSIDTTMHTVRRIAMELRPGVLDDLGLVAALEWQLIDFEKRTGIRCEFFPPMEDISLDDDLSTALFRIFQESLTNVARHSGATEVRVRLCADADSSTLEVEDNGKGIEKEKTLSSKSLGLLGMRERVQMFGGRITVMGTPGIGTKVTVEIPPVEKRKMDRDQEGAAG
jgi:PAS domain S-box-containing protein